MRLEDGFCDGEIRLESRVVVFAVLFAFCPAIDYFSTARTATNPAYLAHILVSLKVHSKKHQTTLRYALVSHHESHEPTVEYLLETGHGAAFREWRE